MGRSKKKRGRKKKTSKYKKIHLQEWKCNECGFLQAYETMRCPICSSTKVVKV